MFAIGCYDKDGKAVFDQAEIEEGVLHHFSTRFMGKRTPVHGQELGDQDHNSLEADQDGEGMVNKETEADNKRYEKDVCSPITATELDIILAKLPNGKSCGIDLVPNELLKNCSFQFKQYLLSFYNKILEQGRVPSALNIGKCCLIWKVRGTLFKKKNIYTFFMKTRTYFPRYIPDFQFKIKLTLSNIMIQYDKT